MGIVGVTAGQEGVARCEPMDAAGLDQKVESAINGNRRGPPAGLGAQKVDQFVGSDRPRLAREYVEDALPPRRHTAGLAPVSLRMAVRVAVLMCLVHADNIGAAARETKVVFWPGLA